MRVPGGVPSAHVDGFARGLLPPVELWPVFDYSAPHLAHYPDRINAAEVLLGEALAAGAGDKPAYVYEGTVWSYRALADRVERIARVLVEEFGLLPGHRVLLRAANCPMVAACWLAVLKAGGICVMTMPLLRARELSYIVGKAEIALALCEIDLAEEMEATRAVQPGLSRVAYFTPLGDARRPEADLDRRAALAAPGAGSVATAADDVAVITFTSGTTGNPKGAMHFHRDLIAVADCWPQWFTIAADEVITGTPSLAFTYGLASMLLYPLRYRASAILLPRPTPEAILEAIGRGRATSLYAVPTAFNSLLPLLGGADLRSLRKCSSAGEHLKPQLARAWAEATGHRLVNGIGMTEMLTHFIAEPPGEVRDGATGRVVPGYSACLLGDDDQPLPSGSRGRLAVRGPTGGRYLGDPERQAAFVRGGWNVTGDIMEQDEDGWFWYVDRADDMIVSAGYNISAQEVERVILDHPEVAECAVVGVPDDARGTIVRACIVLKAPERAGSEMAARIQDFVKASIAPYKYPRDVRFFESLPRTQTGKIQRFRLRQD